MSSVVETRYEFHVSYGETDAMRVVYYGEYFHWFERARAQLIRERGMSYAVVEERGIMLPVREATCRYLRPARYDDLVTIHCRIASWGKASLVFEYDALGQDNCVLAKGSTEHACVNLDGRPVRVPDWLRELLS